MTTTFLDRTRPLPYCPGCGHPHVLKALDQALGALETPAERFVLVTDIGCVGLADAWFPTLHTVHTLHGRAAAVASGIQLAQRAVAPDGAAPLKPIVLVGDGGATLGLLHLVHAAQLDVDITVLVHDNFVYGMTGGQHSGLTPEGLKTTTTPEGSPIPPLDLARVLGGAGCGYFARWRVPGSDLAERLSEAIERPGFACVELMELCPTFAARIGGVTGKKLVELAQQHGKRLGLISSEPVRPLPAGSSEPDPGLLDGAFTPEPAWRRLDRTSRVVVAGRAGERIQSAARLAATAGALAGLHVTVRSENPVTQGHGFSVAELTLSPEPIGYTGLVDPDLVIVTAEEGLGELDARGTLRALADSARLVIDAELDVPDGVRAERSDLRHRFGGKSAALGALHTEIARAGWWEPAAWDAAVRLLPDSQRSAAESVIATSTT